MCAHVLKRNASQADCFRSVLFHAVHGHVEVKAQDYKLVCQLDPRAMWVKLCILVSRYMVTMAEKFPLGQAVTSSHFEGRKAVVVATKIKATHVQELAADLATVKIIDKAVKEIIGHYTGLNPDADKIMMARVNLFANIGKLSLKVGVALDQASAKAVAINKQLTQVDRAEASAKVMKGQLADIEEKYRAELVLAKGVTESEMVDRLFAECKKEGTISTDAKPSAQIVPVAHLLSDSGAEMHNQDVKLTADMVMQRLKISTLPAQVALANLDFIQNKALMKEKLEAAFSKPKAGEDVASINRVYLGRLDVHVRT